MASHQPHSLIGIREKIVRANETFPVRRVIDRGFGRHGFVVFGYCRAGRIAV